MLQLVLLILGYALQAFRIALLVRIIADIVKGLNPGWRPRGALLVILELVFTVTDPLINFIRRFIKPTRMGAVGLDFTPGVALIVVFFAQYLLGLARAWV
jgi:YggT family protein